jgi:hypothetical protein
MPTQRLCATSLLFDGTAIQAFTATVTAVQLGISMTSISSFTTARHSYARRSSKQPLNLLSLFIDPIKVRDIQLFVDRITEIKSTQFKITMGLVRRPLTIKISRN